MTRVAAGALTRLRRTLPRGVRNTLHALAIASDRPTRQLLLRPKTFPATGDVARLALRPLKGRPFFVRPNTSDIQVVWDALVSRYELPPEGIEPETILDLGANIGVTMAYMAALYPKARILGVELDAGNAALCRMNIEPWGERCSLVEGAVWAEDAEVAYDPRPGWEWGTHVTPGGAVRAHGVSLNTLLEPLARVDYVKMDIEGAEGEVLRRNTGWADRVGSIKVEVHPPYSVEECLGDLRRLGFDAARDDRHYACGVGVRR